jgi:hypothetical protein
MKRLKSTEEKLLSGPTVAKAWTLIRPPFDGGEEKAPLSTPLVTA